MGDKQDQKAGDNSQQTQVCAQNYYNININGPLEPECKKFLSSISSTFVTRAEFESFQSQLNESLSKIGKDNITSPSLNVWGTTVDLLKWNLADQQKYIRNMFINILTSDVDKTKKGKVQPSFVEIVKQLGPNDAEFLELAKPLNHDIYDIIFHIKINPGSFDPKMQTALPELYKHGLNSENCEFRVVKINNKWTKLDEIVIDNLERLKIISVENKWYGFGDQEVIKNEIKSAFNIDYTTGSQEKFGYLSERYIRRTSSVSFTDYGKAFADTVFPKK